MPLYMVAIDGKWAKFSNKFLEDMKRKDIKLYRYFDYYISEFQKNPISFFLAHGPDHPIHGNHGRAFLNDYENDLVLLVAPNQTGKSFIGAAYTILRSIPCDPNWTVFKDHGIICPEWTGPKEVVVGTYSWDLMNGIWNTYRMLLPRNELLEYSANWGRFDGEDGKARNLRFHTTGKEVVLNCGTKIIFKCYRQSLSQWESIQCDLAHLDEQCDEDRYDALSQRQITRGNFTPIITTFTGHVIPDRPDTGAAGWIKQKVIDQGVTKGRKVGQYHLDIPSTPTAIMTNKQKEKLRIQWVVEPEKNHDYAKIEEGVARYGGGFQHGAGLTFSAFSDKIHVIKPFEMKKYKPTYYRTIDHGTKPCAAGMFAVMPWGDVVMFAETYTDVPSIKQGCVEIRKMSNSTTRQTGEDYWEEIPGDFEISASECDCRSFGSKSPESGKTLGQIYNENGVSCYPASGQHDDILIPLVQEKFALQKGRQHIDVSLSRRNENELDKMGCPVLYIVENCYNTIAELRKYAGEDKFDHQISVLKFMFGRERPYQGDGYLDHREHTYEFDDHGSAEAISEVTGY